MNWRLWRAGVVEAPVLERVRQGLGLSAEDVVRSQWVDNGAGWLALMLADRDQVLGLQPDYAQLLGLAALHCIASADV